MRTTVTLDADVVRLLREAQHRSRRSFKETLNGAVRKAFASGDERAPRAAFVVRARPLGLPPGVDPTGYNKLADELEADAFREALERTPKSRKT